MLKRAEDPGELQWHQCRWSAAVGRVLVLEDRMQLETGWLSFFRRGWSCADRTLNQFLCLHSRLQQEVKESWARLNAPRHARVTQTPQAFDTYQGMFSVRFPIMPEKSENITEFITVSSCGKWACYQVTDVSVAAAPQFHCNYTRLKLQFTPAVTHEERLDIYSRQNKQIQIQSSVCLQIHVRVSLAVF